MSEQQRSNPVTQTGKPDAGNVDGFAPTDQEGFQPVDDKGNPVKSTDVDSDTGQQFSGTHMEPDERTVADPKDGKPNDALGRTDSNEPEPGKPAKTVKADSPAVPGNYGREQRNEIYKNASKERDAQVNDEESPGHNYLQQLEAEAAGGTTVELPGTDPNKGVDPEALAVAKAIQQEQEGAEGDVDAEPTVTSEVDSTGKVYYIVVNGERQIATEAEIREEGGIEALQKSRSADIRQQDNATERRRIDADRADLTNQVATLVREEAAKLLNQAPPKGNVPSTDRGTASDEAGVKAEEVAQSIYDGDSDSGGEKLNKLIRQVISESSSSDSTVASGDTRLDELVTKVSARLDPGQRETQPTSQPKEQVRANQVYHENFPDLVEATAERPEILERVKSEMARRRSDPLNKGRSLEIIALEIGNDLRKVFLPPTGVSLQDVLSTNDAKAVVVSKRRLRGTQTSAAATAHKPDVREDQTPQYGQSHGSAFQKIKESRNQL